MGKRIEKWKEMGYTGNQIQNTLNYEKYKRLRIKKDIDKIKEERKDEIQSIKNTLKDTGFRLSSITRDGQGYFISRRSNDSTIRNYGQFQSWGEKINLDNL